MTSGEVSLLNNYDIARRENKLRFLSGFSPNDAAHRIVPNGNVNGAVLAVKCIKGAIPVLHGSIGCALHYRYLARFNHVVSDELICTDLTEKELILGGGEKLKKAIIYAYEKYSPSLIVIIPTDPMLVLNADIETVLNDLEWLPDCELLYAKLKTISQPYSRWLTRGELSLSDEEVQAEEDRIKTDFELETENFGCGFSDVYKQLIEELVTPQQKDEKLLVAGGMPVRSGSRSVSDSIHKLLGEFGLNVLFLNTPIEPGEFARAAAAKYSIGFPRGSAYTLKRLFGVEVLPDELWEHLSGGLDGIEKFYLGIADLFGLGDKAAAKIVLRKQMVEQRLREEDAVLDKNNCAFCVDYPGVIPWVSALLRGTLGVRLDYILLTTEDKTYYDPEFSEGDIETIIRRSMIKCVEELGYQPTLYIDPTPEQINKVAENVDFFIGGNHFSAIVEMNRGVTDIPNMRPYSFDGYEEYIISYVRLLRENNRTPQSRLLTEKLRLLENKDTGASLRMRFRAI